jgi:hypothetical protein
MIEGYRVGIGRKGRGGGYKVGSVADGVGKTYLINEAAVRWELRSGVVLFCADDQKGIVLKFRATPITVAYIAAGAIGLGIQLAVHKNAQQPTGSATGDGNVMPFAIGGVACATECGAAATVVDAKGNLAAIKRDAVVAKIAIAKNVTVEDDVAVDPTVTTRLATATGIFAQVGFHPEFQRKVVADVGGHMRVDGDFDPVNVIDAVTIEAQGIAHVLRVHSSRSRRKPDHKQYQDARPYIPQSTLDNRMLVVYRTF